VGLMVLVAMVDFLVLAHRLLILVGVAAVLVAAAGPEEASLELVDLLRGLRA